MMTLSEALERRSSSAGSLVSPIHLGGSWIFLIS
jgi:hypothetical protein